MVPLSHPGASDLTGKRVLISSARHDPIVTADDAERLASLLRQRGADVTLEVQQASHGLVANDLSVAKEWLARSS